MGPKTVNGVSAVRPADPIWNAENGGGSERRAARSSGEPSLSPAGNAILHLYLYEMKCNFKSYIL